MSNINKLYVGGEIYNLSTNVDDVVVTLTMWDSPLGQTIDERINNTIPKPNNIAEYNTDIDSYDIVDDDTPDGFELNERIRIHTNYEDLTIPTTFSAPWGNNRVVIVPDDDIPGYISLTGININEIALIYGYTYELICASHVDNTYTWVVTNKSGTEPVGLLFVSNEGLTQDQKLAIYKYMASVNATGERIANSLGIDYVIYSEADDNDGHHFRIVVKYIDENINMDCYEGLTKIDSGNNVTYIVNNHTSVDFNDLLDRVEKIELKNTKLALSITDVPTKISDLTNDSGYLVQADLKTINGESIVGSGDITVSGGSSIDTSTFATKADVGDKSNLETTAKNTLVAAINEINSNVGTAQVALYNIIHGTSYTTIALIEEAENE